MSAEQEQDTAAKSGKSCQPCWLWGRDYHRGRIPAAHLAVPENAASLSSVNINSTTSGGGRNVMETQHYRDLLRADNERGAAEALRNNETFIASLPRGLDTDTGNDQKRDNPPMISQALPGKTHPPSGRSDCPGKTA